jgi:hypothetical protein
MDKMTWKQIQEHLEKGEIYIRTFKSIIVDYIKKELESS